MKKSFWILIVAMAAPLLSGCPSSGSSAPPPVMLPAVAGDGRIKVEWLPVSGVDYWLFSSTDPSLTAFNWTSQAHAYVSADAPTPFYMCGLLDGVPYYFVTNGRTNGGPGGTSSQQITATPHNASANWTLNPMLIAQIVNNAIVYPDINGVGYASLTTCGNNSALSATGVFAAVGAGGAIFTSNDGLSWSSQISPTTTNLNAVTGYAASLNNPLAPALHLMAVGDAGTVAYYQDGSGWIIENSNPYASASLLLANPPNPTTPNTLRSVMQINGTFFAVGDAGTIISSADAINWTRHPSGVTTNATTQNLNGVTYGGGMYVAVGNNGTLLTSGDGDTWAVPTPAPVIPAGINLQKVAAFVSSYGDIYVAVGDGGTIVTRTSNSGNSTYNWTAQTLPGAPNLVGITVETLGVETNAAWGTVPAADTTLGFITTAQFVAVDAAGNAYTSINGYNWTTSANPTGAIPTGATGVNALTSSGFGYVVTGNSGVSATAF